MASLSKENQNGSPIVRRAEVTGGAAGRRICATARKATRRHQQRRPGCGCNLARMPGTAPRCGGWFAVPAAWSLQRAGDPLDPHAPRISPGASDDGIFADGSTSSTGKSISSISHSRAIQVDRFGNINTVCGRAARQAQAARSRHGRHQRPHRAWRVASMS